MGMELRQLTHFLAVAETRSFSGAADRLNLTAQAVSKSIRALEFGLGIKLFDRDTRSVAITPFGEMLLPHARAIEAEARQFERNLETTLGVHTGVVRLGATPTALTHLVPAALKLLFSLRPQVRVEIERSDFDHLTAPLLRGDLDLLVSTAPTASIDELIVVEPLRNDANVIVCAASHPLANCTPSGNTLAAQRWISLRFPRGESDFRKLFKRFEIPAPIPNLETTAVDFAIDWVATSDYLAILPEQLAARATEDGRLAQVRVPDLGDPWPIVLAYRRNVTKSPATLAFIDALTQAAA